MHDVLLFSAVQSTMFCCFQLSNARCSVVFSCPKHNVLLSSVVQSTMFCCFQLYDARCSVVFSCTAHDVLLFSAVKRPMFCCLQLSKARCSVVFSCPKHDVLLFSAAKRHDVLLFSAVKRPMFCCFQLSYAGAQRALNAGSPRASPPGAVAAPGARCGVSAPGAAATGKTWRTSSRWRCPKLQPLTAPHSPVRRPLPAVLQNSTRRDAAALPALQPPCL